MSDSEFRVTLLHRIAGLVGVAYLHLVGRTSSVRTCDHPGYLGYRRDKRPAIYAFWHNSQVFLAWEHRSEGVSIMVSRSKDGEYIAQVMKRLGLHAVRGSSSRGAEAAFRSITGLLARGRQVGFTPDGPRGPLQRVHGGVIAAAQLTGAPIVPVAMAARRKITFNSWDRFFVPLPFNRIAVAHGRPLAVAKDEDPIAAAERLRQALNDEVARAESALRDVPGLAAAFTGWALSIIYSALTMLLGPFSLIVFLWRHGARRTFRNIGERLSPGGVREAPGTRIWLHAASVGEWQALRPVLAELSSQPDLNFVVTVSAGEARSVIVRDEPNIAVRMLPVDIPPVIDGWIERSRPDAAVIVETELWPVLIERLRRARIPIFIINGRMSARSARRWKFLMPFSRRLLLSVSQYLVRTDLDGQRFCSVGAPVSRVTVMGNTKMDNLVVLNRGDRTQRRSALFGATPATDVIVVAGSTWPGEEEPLLDLLAKRGERRLRLVLAPRKAARFEEVAGLLASVPFTWSRWSKVKASGMWDTDILLVDTLGDLRDLYGAGDIAFVGGSLVPHGGQNPLEPAAAGIPVLFGPSMENFHEEAEDLKRAGGARRLRGPADLAADVAELASDPSIRATVGDAAARVVRSKQGAARRTADFLRSALLLETIRG